MNPSYYRIPSKINALHALSPGFVQPSQSDVKLAAVEQLTGSFDREQLLVSWAGRAIEATAYDIWANAGFQPEPGDVAVFRVERVGRFKHLSTKDQLQFKISQDDHFIGVFGNRYDADGYEGIVAGTGVLHLLSTAGLVGTLISKHESVQYPTAVSLVGYLTTREGRKINLRTLQYARKAPGKWAAHLVLFLGTGMKSGKTTAASSFARALMLQGHRIAVCKLTGSASPEERSVMAATRAHDIRDFTDYGFPSTYLCSKQELKDLFETMLADALQAKPNYVVMELAGGLLQRETALITEDLRIRKRVDCVVLAAACSMSALEGVRRLQRLGHEVAAVSGTMTNSPLYTREFNAQSKIPVSFPHPSGTEIASVIQNQLLPESW